MNLTSWIVLSVLTQVEGRLVFEDGPVPGLADVTIGTGGAARRAGVNDAGQVAAVIGINGNTRCQTGHAILLDDHGAKSMLLCTGQTIEDGVVTQIGTFDLRNGTGLIGDDGVVVTTAFLDGFNGAILRIDGGVADALAVEGRADHAGTSFSWGPYDVMSTSQNGGVGFTAVDNTRIYWAPRGASARLCETSEDGTTSIVATETALWYEVGTEVKRCRIIADEVVVDAPFPGGAGLAGGASWVDRLGVWPAGGGRTALTIVGGSFSDSSVAYWVIDDSEEPPTSRLVAPVTQDPPHPTPQAVSFDGAHVVVEKDVGGFGEPASYEVDGDPFFDTSVVAPGGTRYIVEGYAWFAVALDATVWIHAATATALTEAGTEHTLYRALPGGAVQRVLGSGDTVTTSGGDRTVGLLELPELDLEWPYEHATPIINGRGTATAIVKFDGTHHAVLALGEPRIPDLAPFVKPRLVDKPTSALPLGNPFDLELGIENRGIGSARADLDVGFAPSVAFAGTPPTGCAVVQDGPSAISGLKCQAVAFGDLDTGGSASITLRGLTLPSSLPLPADLDVHLEVRQISGTPEVDLGNSTADVAIALRHAEANLTVRLVYTLSEAGHLIGTLDVTNAGPEDATDVVVGLPGVPVPLAVPSDCQSIGVVTCRWLVIEGGQAKQVTIDFGALRSTDVAAPFDPELDTSSEPVGPGHVIERVGDPEELLATDVEVVAETSLSDGKHFLVVMFVNLSDVTAHDVTVALIDLKGSIAFMDSVLSCTEASGEVTCARFDLPPGAYFYLKIQVVDHGPLALVRAVVEGNVDRDLTNNEVAVAAALDALEGPTGGDEPGEDPPSSGCAGGAPLDIAVVAVALLALGFAIGRRRAR